MEPPLIAFIVMTVLDVPLFVLFGKVLFGSWADFWEAIVFLFTPDFISMLTGEYMDDLWAELKLILFAILCGASVYGELWLIVKWFGEAGSA